MISMKRRTRINRAVVASLAGPLIAGLSLGLGAAEADTTVPHSSHQADAIAGEPGSASDPLIGRSEADIDAAVPMTEHQADVVSDERTPASADAATAGESGSADTSTTVPRTEHQADVIDGEPESASDPMAGRVGADVDAEVPQTEHQSEVIRGDTDGDTAPMSATNRSGTDEAALEADRMAELTGAEVLSADGQSIGTITAVNYSEAETRHVAVIELGGFLGLGSKTVEVPVDSLETSAEGPVKTRMTLDEVKALSQDDTASTSKEPAAASSGPRR